MQNTSRSPSSLAATRTRDGRLTFGTALLGAALVALTPAMASAHVLPTGDTDYELFRSCFGQAPTGACAPMDINGDGVISIWDYLQLVIAAKYDLSGDLIIDYRNTPDNADLNIFRGCYGQIPTGSCKAADFNRDGLINSLDLGLFSSGRKCDFNGDLLVDLRMAGNRPPYFDNLYPAAIFKIPQKERFAFYVAARDFDRDSITYSYDQGLLPENAKFHRVVFGDVNKDQVVDQTDLDLIDASMGTYNPRLDLDNTRTIDQRDHDLALAWMGLQREVLFFSWKPEDDQGGTYPLTLTATDEHGDSTAVTMTLEVVQPAGTSK